MKLILLVTLAAIVAADVSHLTNLPASSNNVPLNSVTGSSNSFSYSTTSAPEVALPFKEHQDFGAQIGNFGSSGYSTPAPFLSEGLVSSTPAPLFASSTVAPSLDFNSLGYQSVANGIGISNAGYSTPAPILNSGSFYSSTPSPILNSGSFFSSTPSPILNSGSFFSSTPASQDFNLGPLVSYDSNSFNLGSDVNPISTSAGSIDESFGVSDYQILPQSQAQVVNKQVFFFSAPEDEPVQTRVRVAPSAPAKKNIRYIFIKAPSTPNLGQVEIAAPPQPEEKTIVYVLAKKPELDQEILVKSAPVTEAPKPEVYFIKYKNQQEAEEAISKAQGGHAEGHVSAHNHEGSNDFVGSISRESSRAQPIISYSNEVSTTGGQSIIGSSNLGTTSGLAFNSFTGSYPARLGDTRFQFNAPTSSFGSQYLNQPAVQLNRGFSFTTPAPIQYNSGVSYSTPAPIQYNSGVSYSTPAPIQYNSGLSYSTASPIQFQSFSTPSPTVNIGSGGFRSAFSGFNSPFASSSAVPSSSFVSSTVAPETSVSSTSGPFSSYGLSKK